MNIKFNIKKDSEELLWQQLRNQLSAYISDQRLPVGTKLPNVKDLADMAEVSLKTSERALQALIEEGICFRRPKKGTFVGNQYAAPTISKVCGICHFNNLDSVENDDIQNLIFQGIKKESENVCDTLFLNGNLEESIRRYLDQRSIDLCGVIMLHWADIVHGVELARSFPRLRFVFTNYQTDDFENTPKNVFGVFNDDFGGAYQLADNLLSRGHEKFGIISLDQDNSNYRRRLEGFSSCVKSGGFTIQENHILSAPRDREDYNYDELCELGQNLAAKLLNGKNIPSVIFAPNDHLAEGALIAVEASGLLGKVEVAGYDALNPYRQRIKFSTVAIDFEKIGRIALKLLTDKTCHYSKITYVNPQLLVKN